MAISVMAAASPETWRRSASTRVPSGTGWMLPLCPIALRPSQSWPASGDRQHMLTAAKRDPPMGRFVSPAGDGFAPRLRGYCRRMPKELSLALVQADAVASPEEFGEQTRLLARQYPNTKMFVFPEHHLQGSWDPWDPGSTERHAESLDGPLSREVARVAEELNVWLVPGSILERAESGVIYNTMVVFTPTGELAASYRKVFPWRPVETCEPGAEFVTIPIADVGTAG